MTLAPGIRLGPYEIIDLLGSGGMGQVYRARDSRLGRQVAVKVLRSDSPFRETLARFEREARTVSSLDHPHICAIYDVGIQDDVHYLVMQHLEGETLDARIRRGTLPVDEVLAVARDIAEGLVHAHRLGVIHRDLKPSNVMLTPTGAKILDFGLATSPNPAPDEPTQLNVQLTQEGSVPGTVPFIAPELLVGRSPNVQTDLWAYGVTLYQAATGRLPFRGRTSFEVMTAIMHDEQEPLPDRFPLRFRGIVSRCLAKDPDRRYGSASAIIDELDRGHETPLEESAASGRSRRWIIVGIVAAVLSIAGGLTWKTRRQPPALMPAEVARGIAVLPFANLSSDPGQEYVADGMTETIIAELGAIRSLRVISRQSVVRYKRTSAPISQIARELGVGAVVTGSVIRSGNELRVTVALIRASPEQQLWSGSYDRSVGDMLTLSTEVARATVEHVNATVTPQEQMQLARVRHVDPEAQQAYLLGRFFWNKRTKADTERAIREFRHAVELDPNAALAYAGLADCFVVALDQGYFPIDDAYREAKASATKALEIDNGIAEAHASLGAVYFFSQLWSAAEQEYRRALALNPGYTTAHQWYSIHLMTFGRHEEAVAEARRAFELDPLSLVQSAFLGQQLYLAGDNHGAVEQLTKALELDPKFSIGRQLLGHAYLEQGQIARGLKEFKQASKLDGVVSGNLGYAYAVAGQAAAARDVLNQLLVLTEHGDSQLYDIGLVYLGLGEQDRAIDWFVRAYQERESIAADLAVDPRLTSIGSDGRFQEILQKSGLTFTGGRAPPASVPGR